MASRPARVAVARSIRTGARAVPAGARRSTSSRPAVRGSERRRDPAEGPFPADTLFIKARDGEFDAVVTMYHDQGQIAIKLLGFSARRHGAGRPADPHHHPAHGTAYDIAGQGKANVDAMANAFAIAAGWDAGSDGVHRPE